ncbi:restriction endonuclease subunit S [Bacillus basilensis]|uniref:restriction endonuclease subunit S n=1 Tax=Bacillus cereus group TaxID=86661 RepID=UPI003D6487B2
MSKNVPKIRFDGFGGDWEKHKVADFSEDTFGGGTPKTTYAEFWGGTIPWIQSSDLQEHIVSNVNMKKGITEIALKKSATKLVPKNSIAIVTRVGVGKLALMPFEYTTSQDFLSLSNLKVNEWFGVYSLYNKLQKESHAVQGTSIKGITKAELLEKNIKIPLNLDEQQKIGTFFKHLDDTIALQQQLVEQQQKYKKAMLQKMFPQKGEYVPKVRFDGVSEDWEEKSLGHFIQDYTEKTTIQNQYPMLTSSQKYGIILQEEYFADRQVTTNNNIGYFVLPRGYFTFRSRSDNGVFKFNRNDLIDKGIISYFYPVFKIINGDSNFFLMLLNSTIKRQVSLEAEGTGQRVLSLKKFKNIKILIPSLKEQQKIGAFFKQLDDTIALYEKKLEDYQQLKKALLQRIFV